MSGHPFLSIGQRRLFNHSGQAPEISSFRDTRLNSRLLSDVITMVDCKIQEAVNTGGEADHETVQENNVGRLVELRRVCVEKISDIEIQHALVTQLYTEADRLDIRSKEAEEDIIRVMQDAKAKTLRTQAMAASRRCQQSIVELSFLLSRHGVK